MKKCHRTETEAVGQLMRLRPKQQVSEAGYDKGSANLH
ncbi:hypothetical protein QFZ64_005855 [Streptomyces sp. B3I8]|nr:hypothetical protein [Streptomyces sp. B3I8]